VQIQLLRKKMQSNAKLNIILTLACGMFSAPNDYFIASRKFIKDEISIQESLVK